MLSPGRVVAILNPLAKSKAFLKTQSSQCGGLVTWVLEGTKAQQGDDVQEISI